MSDKNSSYLVFESAIEGEIEADKKLELSIKFMRAALGEGKKAQFRDFWRIKKVCLELFKGEIHPVKRAIFWADYTTLLTEAHELQKILEEQTSFQVEQIDLAIAGLEKEMQEKETRVLKNDPKDFHSLPHSIELTKLCQEVGFIESFRMRILDLRRELLALEMRVSLKNKMLDRISKLGDLIFPQRKKLLLEISALLSSDVDKFIQENFDITNHTVKPNAHTFSLREKTKDFQFALKHASVTNETYRKIRSQLGQAWEILSEVEKARRVERESRSKEEGAFAEELFKKASELPLDQSLLESAKDIFLEMREKRVQKEAGRKIREVLDKKISAWEAERAKEEEARLVEKNQAKLEHAQMLDRTLNELESFLPKITKMELSKALTFFDEKKKLLQSELVEKKQKIRFEQVAFAIEDKILELEASQLEGHQIEGILQRRVVLRDSLKEAIQRLREEITKVGLDFELALELRRVVDSNKMQLEKVEEAIGSLQEKQ